MTKALLLSASHRVCVLVVTCEAFVNTSENGGLSEVLSMLEHRVSMSFERYPNERDANRAKGRSDSGQKIEQIFEGVGLLINPSRKRVDSNSLSVLTQQSMKPSEVLSLSKLCGCCWLVRRPSRGRGSFTRI